MNLDDASLSGSPDASVSYVLTITSFVPTSVNVSTPTFDMTPTVTWSSGVGAVRYEVYVKNLATNQVIRQTATDTSWTSATDLGIARYQVWVRSINAANVKSTWSLPASFVVNTPVTIPAQTLGQTVRPQITWTALPGAASYEIWLTDASRKIAPFLQQTGLTSTSWTPASDLALGTYTFWVRGIDAVGRVAAWSSKLTFNVQAAPVPSSLMASTFSRQPEFRWTAPAGSSSFVVTLANQTTGASQTISGITGTSWTPTSNLADGRWTWRVRAVSQFGNMTYWSELAQIHVGGQVIVATPSATRTSPATFNWTAVSGAASYSLWVNRVDVPQAVIRRDNITTNSFTTSTPLAAGTYRVWVRAVSTTGEVSAWSRTVEFTVASADLNEPSRDDEHVLVKLNLSVLPTWDQESAEAPFDANDAPICDSNHTDETVRNDVPVKNQPSADQNTIELAGSVMADSSETLPIASIDVAWDVFGLLDESDLHQLLHSL